MNQAVLYVRVRGRLRRSEDIPKDTKHPIVMDSAQPIVKLIIWDYDERILHCGPERVLAENRRTFSYCVENREAIRKHQ